jgi:hypothetical protein
MSITPAGQSLFTTNGAPIAFEGLVLCTLTHSNDDMDSTMMWVDFTGKVDMTNTRNPISSTWMTLPRGSSPASATNAGILSPQPSGVSSSSRPVPFPGAGNTGGIVVWLDASQIRFAVESTDYAFAYPTNYPSACAPSTAFNQNIFVTDGISSVTVGRRSGTTIQCLTTLTFDWSAAVYSASMVTCTGTHANYNSNTPPNFHDTEEDANGGDLLWTVNGKPAYVSGGRP